MVLMDKKNEEIELLRDKVLDVKDEKVEHEIHMTVMLLADEIGMSTEFALRLLNILLTESEHVQVQKTNQKPVEKKQTHLGIFAKAKQLEASGKKIIHMEVGEPDYPPPARVGPALAESFKMELYHYTDTLGIAKLRDAIATKEGGVLLFYHVTATTEIYTLSLHAALHP